MRKSFFDALSDVADKENDLIFMTADLGFGFVENFIKKHPKKFLNVGVSEQAMLGLANGLATGGKKVICYSIASFSLIRPFEFFRNGAIAHDNSVMVVGVGPGFDYSQDGISHYCLEDLAIMQSQPGILIATPFTEDAVPRSLNKFALNPQPMYLRLPRNIDDSKIYDFEAIDPKPIDTLIYCTALMGKRANKISTLLTNSGQSTVVGSCNEISATFDKTMAEHLRLASQCLVIEDHYEFGGLGSRIGDVILSNNLQTTLVKDGVTMIPKGTIGSFEYMENKLMKSIQSVNSILLK
jgi:transketolase